MKSHFTTIFFVYIIVFLACVHMSSAQKKHISCPGINGLTSAEILTILGMHNDERLESGLRELVWDCKLAVLAQAWVILGVVEHQNMYFGENIFVASNTKTNISEVFARWNLEKANWSNTSGTCLRGKTCSHYTQIMAKESERVGCGINRANMGKWPLFLVCNYDPPGNMNG